MSPVISQYARVVAMVLAGQFRPYSSLEVEILLVVPQKRVRLLLNCLHV